MPKPEEHPSVSRVRQALASLGCADTSAALPDSARTAAEAGRALGTSPAAIASSIVFGIPDPAGGEPRPLLVITSGAHRVDTSKVAAVLEVPEVLRVDANFVRQHSGFAIGGVAPIGWQPAEAVGGQNPLAHQPETLIDVTLAAHPRVWAAAGHPHVVFETSYAELLRITGGQPCEVA